MKHKVEPGSVSYGTLREEDLIPAFYDALDWYKPRKAAGIRRKYLKIFKFLEDGYTTYEGNPDFDNFPFSKRYTKDDLNNDIHLCIYDLINKLDALSPPYFYFGTSPGDLADYGWWLYEDIVYEEIEDYDAISVSDLNDIPPDYVGNVFEINDHRNITLYNRGKNHHLYEIWSLV